MDMKLDSWTTERDGVTYQVALYADDDSNEGDIRGGDEGMREETVAAHQAGDWAYVGVVVTPVIGGQTVEAAQDSLWGVEYGTLPPTSAAGIPRDDSRFGSDNAGVTIDREYITSVHPVPDMIPEVRGNLAKLGHEITGLNLG